LKIDLRKHGRINILAISGKLIIGQGDVALRAKLKEMLDAGERFFLFDMTEVSYMDSAGLGAVVSCAKRAREKSGVLKVIAVPQGKVDTLFSVTGLSRAFDVYADEQTALDSFSR
jgi:anti-sigma B factor antagonist